MAHAPQADHLQHEWLVCRELAECKFAEYPIDTYGKPTLGMAPLFSSQWSASQEATQSQDLVPGIGGRSSSNRAIAGGATLFTQVSHTSRVKAPANKALL